MDKERNFLVNRGEIKKRLDPFFYIPSLVALERTILQKGSKPLRSFIKTMASGATPKVAEEAKFYSTKEKGGIPFIRVQNLSETGELFQDEFKYINDFTHNIYLKRSQVREGNLLTKITGVGRMAVSSVAPQGFLGNINQHIVVSKTESFETSEVLAAFLNSDIGERLATRRATGGTRPALDYPALRSIPIIYKPEIVDVLKNGVKAKNDREAKANELLRSIDTHLLKELGIILPSQPENTTENRIFRTDWKRVLSDRFDPSYYTINWELTSSKLKTKRLPEMVFIDPKTNTRHLKKDEEVSFIPMERVTETGDIQTTETRPFSESKGYTVFQEGDLLWAKITPCMENGKSAIANGLEHAIGFGSTEYFVFRPKTSEIHMPFLYFLLHTEYIRNEAKKTFGGSAGHQRVSKDFFKRILLPIPEVAEQVRIANELVKRKTEALKLFEDADREFIKVKKEIEKLILE